MEARAESLQAGATYPLTVEVRPAVEERHVTWGYGSGGALSVVAGVVALVAWFAILFTGRHPGGLWRLKAFL